MPEPAPALSNSLALAKTVADRGRPATVQPLPPLTVRYYQRMKRQRVYPFVVRWGKATHPHGALDTGGVPLLLRPVIPGAQVVPAESFLEPSQPEATATFYVTPLALGRLPKAHVEVFQQGRKVENIRLRIIVVRQLVTWVLLALALLLPALLIFTTRDFKLTTTQHKMRPATEQEKKAVKNRSRLMAKASGKTKAASGKAGNKNNGKAEATKPAAKDGEIIVMPYLPKSGELLTDKLNSVLPWLPGVTDNVAAGLGDGYQYICDAMQADARISLYLGLALLVLAGLSLLLHASCPAWAQGRPLALPRLRELAFNESELAELTRQLATAGTAAPA